MIASCRMVLNLVFVSTAFASGVALAAAPTAPPKTWTGEQKKIQAQMDELFAASKQVKQPGDVGKSAKRKVEASLDWQQISKDCLGKDISGAQSAGDLKKFEGLLRDVVVKTAYSRLETFWKSVKGYEFDKIEVKKDTATVLAKFTVDSELYDLEYFLRKKNGMWWIVDISFEGVRYSGTIHEKLKEFFQEKKSFSSLIERLSKRRQELLDEENKPAAAKPTAS